MEEIGGDRERESEQKRILMRDGWQFGEIRGVVLRGGISDTWQQFIGKESKAKILATTSEKAPMSTVAVIVSFFFSRDTKK